MPGGSPADQEDLSTSSRSVLKDVQRSQQNPMPICHNRRPDPTTGRFQLQPSETRHLVNETSTEATQLPWISVNLGRMPGDPNSSEMMGSIA